jgi:hypothetical protein
MRVCFPGYSDRATLVLLRRSMGNLPALRSVSENGPGFSPAGALFLRRFRSKVGAEHCQQQRQAAKAI